MHAKEYLTFDSANPTVHVLHNFSFDEVDCNWRYVQHRLLPPACLPGELPENIGIAFEVLKRDEWILRGGLQAGVPLTLPRLKQVMSAIQCPFPTKGSGKNGRTKKVDFVTALVKHLWSAEPEEFLKDIINKMMGFSSETTDLSVLSMLSELDTENQEAFSRMKEEALKTLQRKLYGEAQAAAKAAKNDDCGDQGDGENAEAEDPEVKKHEKAADKGKKIQAKHMAKEKKEHERQWNLTPPALKALLPGAGDISGAFWMRWHPHQHWWRVTYPTRHLAKRASRMIMFFEKIQMVVWCRFILTVKI